jgi:hypothetical protein
VKPRRVLGIARRLLLLYALVGVAYLAWRFEIHTLPAKGCSPLISLRPGAHLLVDGHPPELRRGDTVLFRDPAGRLLIARIAPRPDSAGDGPGYWLETDNGGCPGPDSRSLGLIPRERSEGRMLFAFSW